MFLFIVNTHIYHINKMSKNGPITYFKLIQRGPDPGSCGRYKHWGTHLQSGSQVAVDNVINSEIVDFICLTIWITAWGLNHSPIM